MNGVSNAIQLWKEEKNFLLTILLLFLAVYFLPIENTLVKESLHSALALLVWYAREHVLLCLIPAFFIAGVIAVFISQASVIRYLGAGAKQVVAYLIASVSGTVLAVCSCTVLPLFSGIYRRGAGLGPAIAFLYSGPAINILSIILTLRVLGVEIGVARVIGAVTFSIVIGLVMAFLYGNEEQNRTAQNTSLSQEEQSRPLWQMSLLFFTLVGILVAANWGAPASGEGVLSLLYMYKWEGVAIMGIVLAVVLVVIVRIPYRYVLPGALATLGASLITPGNPTVPFVTAVIALTIVLSLSTGEASDWMKETWGFTKQIMPLLAIGVFAAGFFLGTPDGGTGMIPNEWIVSLVGGNSLGANLFASIAGAFMYFATLTEIPIVQGLIDSGMGKGPALALLLSGPALSLPNMLVIRSVIGTRKTIVYVGLVVLLSTVVGMMYGLFFY